MEKDKYLRQRMLKPKEFIDRLGEKLYNILDINDAGNSELAYKMLCSTFGHSEKHIGQTDAQLLKRVIDEGKTSTSFNSLAEYVSLFANALIAESPKICKWVQGDIENRNDYKILTIKINMGELVGSGWRIENGKYQKKETEDLTIVLERDTNRDTEFAFYPVTVYADIRTSEAKNIGRPVDPYDVAYNMDIQYSGKLERCLARYRHELPKGYDIAFLPKNENYPDCLMIMGKSLQLKLRDRNDELEIKCESYPAKKDLDYKDIKEKHPDLSFFVSMISAGYEHVRTGGRLPDRRVTEAHVREKQKHMKTISIKYESEVPSSLQKTDNGYKLSTSLDDALKRKSSSHETIERTEIKSKDER